MKEKMYHIEVPPKYISMMCGVIQATQEAPGKACTLFYIDGTRETAPFEGDIRAIENFFAIVREVQSHRITE